MSSGGFGLARYLNPAPIAVQIDIQPGRDPNTVDPATVTLASATPASK